MKVTFTWVTFIFGEQKSCGTLIGGKQWHERFRNPLIKLENEWSRVSSAIKFTYVRVHGHSDIHICSLRAWKHAICTSVDNVLTNVHTTQMFMAVGIDNFANTRGVQFLIVNMISDIQIGLIDSRNLRRIFVDRDQWYDNYTTSFYIKSRCMMYKFQYNFFVLPSAVEREMKIRDILQESWLWSGDKSISSGSSTSMENKKKTIIDSSTHIRSW